jgi:large subunit ribosomal protein L21
MYAVVRSGGKQVRLAPGRAVREEKLPGEVGEQNSLDEFLMVGGEGETRDGRPLI